MNTTDTLAKFLVETKSDDIPEEAMNLAKGFICYGLGYMLGGSREEVTQMAIRVVKEEGGADECGVVGGGFRTSLTNAVFVNGLSGHALELEP